MLASHGLLHVSAGQRIAYAAIHFWLLFAQLMSGATVSSCSTAPPTGDQLPLQAPPPPLLMDKTLTNCGDAASHGWRPVCATANGVDYVLFGSECLLRQANRERHYSDTGDARAVFREIALGFCRPSCSLTICERNERAICARNVNSGEVRSFSGHCDMARDVCVNDNDWQMIPEDACARQIESSEPSSSTSTTPAAPLTTAQGMGFTLKEVNENHGLKARKKVQGKSIPCPKVFNPVCAELFGVKATFINECLVNAENVKFDKDWQIFSEGVCQEDYASSETHKNGISKRSTVASATITFELNAPEQLQSNATWTSNIENTNYMNEDVFSSYGGEMRRMLQYNQPYGARYSEQSPLDAITHSIRILPSIDDRVSDCKFGAGPVCGRSLEHTVHKFENICELLLRNLILNESWTVVNENKCRRCVLNCTTDYDPICITRNGINYTIINQCHLDHAICRNNLNSWNILGKGECPDVLKNIPLQKSNHIAISPVNGNEAYFPRHTRKILEILSEEEAETLISQKPPVATDQKSSSEVFDFRESQSPSSSETLHSSTTSTPFENNTPKTHIMNLWRSTKRKPSVTRRKRN